MTGSMTGSATDPMQNIFDLLRAGGGRITTSRRLVVTALLGLRGHITAEALCDLVQATAPDVVISTIYRNLEELERLGVVVHSHLGHGPAVYHLASATHAHLVCSDCGAALDAPEEFFGDLAKRAATCYGFTVDPRHFAILGRCRACQTPARTKAAKTEAVGLSPAAALS
jgi:Fur family ferric uptake transcriptional regulator